MGLELCYNWSYCCEFLRLFWLILDVLWSRVGGSYMIRLVLFCYGLCLRFWLSKTINQRLIFDGWMGWRWMPPYCVNRSADTLWHKDSLSFPFSILKYGISSDVSAFSLSPRYGDLWAFSLWGLEILWKTRTCLWNYLLYGLQWVAQVLEISLWRGVCLFEKLILKEPYICYAHLNFLLIDSLL